MFRKLTPSSVALCGLSLEATLHLWCLDIIKMIYFYQCVLYMLRRIAAVHTFVIGVLLSTLTIHTYALQIFAIRTFARTYVRP